MKTNVIDLTNSPKAQLYPLSLQEITIDGGFWERRQAINRDNSPATRLVDVGRIRRIE